MKGMDYNIALTVFFISYALLEVPSNIILKMMKPSHWIAIMMFAVSLLYLNFFYPLQAYLYSIVGSGNDVDGCRPILQRTCRS
jgi:hypothetical protein